VNHPVLPQNLLDRLSDSGDRIEIEEGTEIIREGDFEESIYLIESGRVEVLRGGTVIGTIEAGDLVGEMAFIDRRPRSATVRAGTSSILRKMEREELLRDLGKDPEDLLHFVRILDSRRQAHLSSAANSGEQDVEIFLQRVTEEAIAHRAVNHPYLLALRNHSLPDMNWALADFACHYHGYSSHFPRFLTTVIGRLEIPEHRTALMENLTEEAGIYEADELEELADIGVEKEWVDGIPHPILFRRFCEATGVENLNPESDSVEVVCWREMFLSVLSGGSPAEAVGALGLGTENVVSTMYQHFLPAITVLEIDPRETVFFPLHAAVDDHHQETLLDISRHYAATPSGRVDLVKGMRKALALRAGFWDWLHLRASTLGRCDDAVPQ